MAAPTLPQAPDMSAIRRKLQQGMGTAVGALGSMPYDATWDNRAADAYGQLGTKLSANDLSGQRLDQDYETNRAQQALGQEHAIQGLRNNFANNGTLFSGAYVDKQADTNTQYQNIYNQLAQGKERGHEDINRSNTAAMADYQRSLADIGTGYTNSVRDYLAKQASATANADQQNQLLAAQRALQALTSNPDWMKQLYANQSGIGGIT